VTEEPEPKPRRHAWSGCLLVATLAAGALLASVLEPDDPEGTRTLSHPQIEWVLGLRFAGDRLQVVSRSGMLLEEGEGRLHPLTKPLPGGFGSTRWEGEFFALPGQELWIVEVATGKARKIPGVELPRDPIVDEGLVATTSILPGLVRVHDVASGALVWEADLPYEGQLGKVPFSHLAHSGGLVALSMGDRVALFEATTGVRLPDLGLPAGFVPREIALDRRGTRLVATGLHGDLHVWSVVRPQPLAQIRSEAVLSVAFSRRGDQVALGGGDLNLYDLEGRLLATYEDPSPVATEIAAERLVRGIAFSEHALAWAIKDRSFVVELPPETPEEAARAWGIRGLDSYQVWAEAPRATPDPLRRRWRRQAAEDLQRALTAHAELPATFRGTLSPKADELKGMLQELE
jgi:putative pyrroloquinoline-quinone binding quinoprotein